ncbi:MAG: GNAT family N-acetyltransferase [Candidatus Limnocylindrales bacterium]
MSIEGDEQLYLAASPVIRGPAFNRASGRVRMPHLQEMATAFFDRHRVRGWLIADDDPWPNAEDELVVGVFGASIGAIESIAGATVPTLTMRPIDPEDADRVVAIHAASGSVGVGADQREPWARVYERLARHPDRIVLIAEIDGLPIAAASLHVDAGVGWLRGASVVPSVRGRGVQRALIARRIEIARERGCDVVGAWAQPHGVSASNALRMGMRQIGLRRHFRYTPPGIRG